MILTSHQPVYLPWLGLFHKIALSDAYCYLDTVQYQIQDYNNRNSIKTANGPHVLTVPVKSKGYMEKRIKDIEIDPNSDWSRRHWKTMFFAYKKAPYFAKYAGFFEDVYRRDWQYLSDLNEHMLKWFLQELGLDVAYSKASEQRFERTKSALVLDMCRQLKARCYVFGAQGKNYADQEQVKSQNVALYFQSYAHPVYKQMHGLFVSNVSICDLRFNEGPDSLAVLMSGNMDRATVMKECALSERSVPMDTPKRR